MLIGAKFIDRDGKVIGKIDYLIRDSWSGEIKKYIVSREAPNDSIFLSPEDILGISETEAQLKNQLTK